jgi:uncharacterized protein
MSQFVITSVNPKDGLTKKLIYNSTFSTLTWEDGTAVIETRINNLPQSQKKLEIGKAPKTVKIQLGLSCNFECDYCNQRFVPHADSTNPNDIQEFVEQIPSWFDGGEDGKGSNRYFEFWGGEPLVYWKTLKPLAEEIRAKYPNSEFSIITNGSLLDKEKVDWLNNLRFTVGISHDAVGQFIRGPDPLDDPSSREGIIYAYKTLAPLGRVSFNSMITNKNISRKNIQLFFEELIRKELGEEYVKYLSIGEGTFIDAYDEGGTANSLMNDESHINYRKFTFDELRADSVTRYSTIQTKISNFIKSLETGVRKETLSQKCGMDKSENIAIDLKGNVLTCQNVSTVSHNPSGISHHLGNVKDLKNIEIKTGTHWSDREECSKCPVLHICKGACFFLTGPLWEATCDNSFSDNIVIFCAAIEILTGHIPVYIDGPLRQDRKDIFWMINGKVETKKKVIPIVSV